MARTMRIARRLLVGVMAVLGFTLIGSAHIPVYDGVGFPDEPYRYLQPPAGAARTAAPGSVKSELSFTDGINDEMDFYTSEYGPQIDLFLLAASLTVRSPRTRGVISVDLHAVPLVAPPSVGQPNSNDYLVRLSAPGTVIGVARKAFAADVTLRAADTRLPSPVMNYRSTSTVAWQQLHTDRYGQDSYSASFVGSSEYLLVEGPNSGADSTAPAGHPRSRLWVFAVVGAAVVVGLIAVRLRSTPGRT